MAQFFPGDDTSGAVKETFTSSPGGAGSYGRSPSLYVRAWPWQTFWHDNRNLQTQFPIRTTPGHLHDAIAGKGVISPDLAAVYRPGGCVLARGVHRSNVRVTLEASLYRHSGTIGAQYANSSIYGVLCRMGYSGTIDAANTQEEALGSNSTQSLTFTGYGFYVVGRAGTGVRYAIVKLRTDDSLGPEVLVQRNETQWWPYDPSDTTNGQFGPAGIALVCETVGSDVVLTAYQRNMKAGGGWQQLATYTDTAANSPHTYAGRCGFIMGQHGDNQDAISAVCGAVAEAFEIRDITGTAGGENDGTLFFRDEFSRRNRETGRSWGTGGGSAGLGGTFTEPAWTTLRDPHYSLHSQYHGDLQSTDVSGWAFYDVMQDGTDKAEVGGSRTPGSHASCQSYDVNQHFEAKINFTDESADDAYAGMILRYSDFVSPPSYIVGQGVRGYGFRVQYTGGAPGSFEMQVFVHGGGGDPVRLASDALPTLSHGTEFTLACEVQTLADGRVAMGVQVNGTYVNLNVDATGCEFVDGKWLIVDRADNVTDGAGFAPVQYSTSPVPRPLVTFDDIYKRTLSTISVGGGGGGEEEDENTDLYGSTPIDDEQVGATGTLDVEHSWPERVGTIFRVSRHELRGGHLSVRSTDRRGRRTFEVNVDGETIDRVQLADFIEDHNGGEIPFTWTTRDGEALVVKFSRKPDLRAIQNLPFAERATLELVELFGPGGPGGGTGESTTINWESVTQPYQDIDGEATLDYFNMWIRADGYVEPRASTGSTLGGGGTDTTRAFKIVFDAAAQKDGEFTVELSGDAVYGTHYTVDSTTFSISAGNTEKTITVTVLDPGLYFEPKDLVMRLIPGVGVIAGDQPEFRITFYYFEQSPTAIDPPSLRITASNVTTSPSTTDQTFSVHCTQGLLAGGDSARVSGMDTTVRVRAIASGGLVKDSDYWIIAPGTIAQGQTSTSQSNGVPPQVRIRAYNATDSIVGETVDVYLDHEPNDRSEENFWAFTDDWRIENTNGTLGFDLTKSLDYAGLPTTHANGGGGNLEGYKDQPGNDIVSQEQVRVPGNSKVYTNELVEAQVILQSERIASGWYIRESFEASEFCGTTERKQVFDGYLLFWTYVGWISGPESSRNSDFMQIVVRNRAPGNMEMGVTFRRVAPGSATSEVAKQSSNADSVLWSGGSQVVGDGVATDAGVWGLWTTERLHPSSKWGVEEEVDDLGRKHTRLWCLAKIDGTLHAEGNDPANVVVNDTAASGSTGTVVISGGPNFNTYKVQGRSGTKVNSGSRIYNRTTQTSGYVKSRDSATQLTCEDGITFSPGDTYYVQGQGFSVTNQAFSTTDLTAQANVDFNEIEVNVGDLVVNDRGRSKGVITLVAPAGNAVRVSGLSGFNAYDTNFEVGDKCFIYANGGTGGLLTADVGTNATTLIDADGLFLVRGVGKFDEVYNVTRTEFAEIQEVVSETELTIDAPSTWAATDQYELRMKWMQPREGWAGNAIYRMALTQGNDGRNGQTSSNTIVGGVAGLRGTGAIAWGPGYLTRATEAELLTGNRPCPVSGPIDPDATTPKNKGVGRHWPKRSAFHWQPIGGATKDVTRTVKWTLTIGNT